MSDDAPTDGGPVLADGTYDASDGQPVTVELTIVVGPAKGEVVSLRASGFQGDPLDLLGVPATLTVAGGVPSVRFEP